MKKIKKLRIFTILGFIVILVLVVIVGLNHRNENKNSNINISNKSNTTVKSTALPVATNSNSSAKDAANNNTSSDVANSDKVGISLNAAGQDYAGGPILLKSQITGLDSGSCTAEMTNNNTVKNFSSNITLVGNFYSCNITIPNTDLYPGNWNLTFTVQNNTKYNSINRSITVQ
jgi:hypothetical protein